MNDHTETHAHASDAAAAAAAAGGPDREREAEKTSPYVYVSNLPADAYEGTIRHAFEQEGIEVATIQLLQKGSFNRRRNAGLATVKLASAADAQRCCDVLDGKMLHAGADAAHGRPMIVRRNKFECCQLGYDPQQQQQQLGSRGSSCCDDAGS